MKKALIVLFFCLILWVLGGCAVMPPEVNDQALPPIPFDVLINDVNKYMGDTVIVGGHVVSVDNQANITKIIAVQTPLGVGQKPKIKDTSQGRLVLVYNGFIDPEVYTKDRLITAGGKITGSSALDRQPDYPYLQVEVGNIHLWPVEKPLDAYWDDDYYPYHYPWWWHPYRHRHWHH